LLAPLTDILSGHPRDINRASIVYKEPPRPAFITTHITHNPTSVREQDFQQHFQHPFVSPQISFGNADNL
jgi:hypothetical protein